MRRRIPAAASGRLTLAAFGLNGGTALTVGNSAVGTTAGEFNGILQLQGANNHSEFTNTAILRNSAGGTTLTIARSIVQLHGGEIHALTDGRRSGASIRILLPRKRSRATVH